jgi:hypothetical protein
VATPDWAPAAYTITGKPLADHVTKDVIRVLADHE